MPRSVPQYLPVDDVRCFHQDEAMVLSTPNGDSPWTLSETGEEIWALLQSRRNTVDRLVMSMARRSSGQALAFVPDRVQEELDGFVRLGFVQRVADV